MTLDIALNAAISNPPQLSLAGRTALITGGSRGMGRAIAYRFAQAGSKVILIARRSEVLSETKAEIETVAPGTVEAIACDVADRSQITALCERLDRERSTIDILVNNAGGSATGAFEDQSDEVWQADLDLKLFAAIRLARHVLPGMKQRRWGRILNVVSIIGKTPFARGAPTCVTRAAGIALTKVLASEFAPFGVLVNALCTGRIVSDQLQRFYATRGTGMTFEEFVERQSKPIPLGRYGAAEEFANVALFLASEAAAYVTGAAINIDGGLCAVV